jgi:cell division protein DivIC
MKFFENLKNKKIFFFQIFLTLYIVINLIGGERGLFSYFKKNTHEKLLSIKSSNLKKELESIEYKNKLLTGSLDIDYLETLYRAKFNFCFKD